MDNSLQNKVIAVTGAAQGIGLATATLLASRGAVLSLADVKKPSLEAARDQICSLIPNVSIMVFTLDVRDSDQVSQWISDTVRRFGRLDGAANIAGVVPGSIASEAGLVENIDSKEWEFCISINLTGTMHCMKHQLGAMKQGGSVVNMGSVAGLIGRERNGIYTASKHGVMGLTRSAAKEVGRRGTRVNAICPGRIETPMSRDAADAANAAGLGATYERETMSDIALRRKGEPEEVAKLVAFLLGDDSSYITGASINIDGGWIC